MDGKLIEAQWNIIGNSNMAVSTVELVRQSHIMLSHDTGEKFMAYLYGAQDRESYAMPCGVNIAPSNHL